MRKQLYIFTLLGMFSLATVTVQKAKKSDKKPNIILILTDDQGWTDTSVPMIKDREDTRSDFYQTPTLKKLAKEGTVFSSAYSASPVCSPSRDYSGGGGAASANDQKYRF